MVLVCIHSGDPEYFDHGVKAGIIPNDNGPIYFFILQINFRYPDPDAEAGGRHWGQPRGSTLDTQESWGGMQKQT